MDKIFNQISIIIGVTGGTIAYFLGGWDKLLQALVLLVVLDYVTGIIKAICNKILSSEVGFKGILKKVLLFIVIAVACNIQSLINNTIPLREVVIMFYIANEGLSLLENASEFIPIPEQVKNLLLQLREKE